MFNDPQLYQKLASNPKTSGLLGDAEFMAKLQRLKSNPNNIGMEMRDPRFLQVMSVLLGIDMSFGQPGEGAGAAAGGDEMEIESDVHQENGKP
ncbi:Hsp90 cochaperone, partial [Cryomyces antarcticus]